MHLYKFNSWQVFCFVAIGFMPVACGKKANTLLERKPDTVEPATAGSILRPDKPELEKVFLNCEDGLKIKLPPISGKDWNKSISRHSPSILVEANTVADLEDYATVSLSNETGTRKIMSIKIASKGREILILDGDVIKEVGEETYFCFQK